MPWPKMAGSDPSESVTIYAKECPGKELRLPEKDVTLQIDTPRPDDHGLAVDETEPFNRDANQTGTSSASYLSITRTFRQLAVASVCLIISVLFNLTVLAVIHERVPRAQPPLPDVAFSLLPKIDRALDFSEYIILFMTASTLFMTLFHRYRSIVFRRLCFILALLYLLRAICMAVTQLPIANPQYYCSPQLNLTENSFEWWSFTKTIASRVSHLSLGMGLSVNGRHSFCGDYIFSGHTIMLVTTYHFLGEYWLSSKRALRWRLLQWTYLLLGVIGIICIIIARGHYTVDIVLGYFIASRIFLIYHSACDMALLQTDNSGRVPPRTFRYQSLWWYSLFAYIESDTIKYQIKVANVFEVKELFSSKPDR